jgi:hypothetical protein
LLITWLLIAAVNSVFGQNLDKKITIVAHNQPLGDVIKQISVYGEILFSYNPQSLPLDKKITVVARNVPVKLVFEKVFTANGIDFTVSEKQVILRPHVVETPANQHSPAPPISKYTISGYIRDKTSGEAIISANVYDVASYQGTTTNAYGFYSLSLPKGEYKITNSYVGYTSVSQTVMLDKNLESTVELEIAPVNIKEVVITADPDVELFHLNQSGDIKLSPAVLKQMPGFAGNIDVVKSLQNVPGIVTFGDGSSFYYVRGGNSDQNLLLIDEAPIYNPSHMFGFFSALAPDAIKDVIVYKGDFPANYGGRLSSVVDVRGREGNLKRIGFAGNIGPFTTDLTLEGPIIKEKSSFLISGRKSTLNWLQWTNSENQTYSFGFYDLNAKFNIWLNKNNRLFLTAFTGNDVYDRYNSQNKNTFGISWKNVASTLRWNHVFNSKLFSNTTAYFSQYNYYLDISKELKNYWNSSITNATIKTDLSWYLNPKNTLKTGLELNSHQSNPGNVHYTDAETQGNLPHIAQYQSTEIAMYLSNSERIGEKISANYGLRLSRWNDLGPTTVYYFDANYKVIDTIDVDKNTVYKSFLNLEPRINLRYSITDNSSIQINYNHTVQYLQVLSNSTSPFTSLEVWVPSGPNIKPQLADQFSLGFFTRQSQGQFEFSAELFYKKLYNQIDYADHANMLFNPLLEGELRFGEGHSYGIETLIRKSKGNLTGWMSYTYSRSMKQIADVNSGNTFPAICDRPHTFSFTLAYASGKHWSFSSHWIYLTGAPFTSPTGFYYLNGYSIPIYGEKNNDRFPNYHRLDVSVAFALSKPEKRFQHSLMLTVYNAYGRHNPFEQNFNKIMDDNGNIVVPTDLQGSVERIPTSVSVAGAIPSLNYTFRF